MDLKENKKGIHMSRIIESINEVVESDNISASLKRNRYDPFCLNDCWTWSTSIKYTFG